MKRHDSMRGWFAYTLHEEMGKDKRIFILTGGLGFSMLDPLRDDYPERFVNTEAAEQTLMDIACGLAIEGKIPFVYSITPFLIYRPFECLRTYVNHENLNVKLVGSGRDADYHIDGWSHNASDVKQVLDTLPNIKQLWPEKKEDIPDMVRLMVDSINPMFISLRR